nr:non-ribosomal peptide synthetase [Burkholderia ubonensis]
MSLNNELFERTSASANRSVSHAIHSERQYRLSSAQRRLWLLDQLNGNEGTFSFQVGLHLHGPLDRTALRRALDGIVARNEILRTTFASAGGEPLPRVAPESNSGFQLTEHDVQAHAEPSKVRDRLIAMDARIPMSLEQGPLIRGTLIRESEREYTLLLTAHRIVVDNVSMEILLRELDSLYRAEDPLPPETIQYGDYLRAQQQSGLAQEAWESRDVEVSSTPSTRLTIPVDRERPLQRDFASEVIEGHLAVELAHCLKALAHRNETSLFVTLLTGWAVLLARLSGQGEVLVGTSTDTRGTGQASGMIGCFSDMLALRLDCADAPSTAEMLVRVQSKLAQARQYRDIPLERALEVAASTHGTSRGPVFQAMFSEYGQQTWQFRLPGLTVTPAKVASRGAALADLALSFRDAGETVVFRVEYATELLDRSTVERHIENWRTLLAAMTNDEHRPVDRLSLLSEPERRQLLVEWNDTAAPYAHTQCIHELFQAWASRTPDAIAAVQGDVRLTYAALNEQANRLAHYLRKLGVVPDQRVAICVERGPSMLVGIWAVLKAGAAYVPLDPAYPANRLAHMLRDSAPAAVLTQGELDDLWNGDLGEALAGAPRLDLTAKNPPWAHLPTTNPDRESIGLMPTHLAYVIYTSGSTGLPKGVMVEHGGIVSMAVAQARGFTVSPASRVLQFASFSFDACIFEIVMALCHGATLYYPAPGAILVGDTLIRTIDEYGITHATLTPAVLAGLSERARLASVDTLIVAGDALPQAMVQRWGRGRRLINAYGPTEATVWASQYDCRHDDPRKPPIGRPIANAKLYVLDEHRQPVPIGVAGELYVGGVGVARGYLNRAELTAERFLHDPFSGRDDAKMYRTGDLARWLPDGNIEYLGRCDFQVKVRGFRIELGEIESRLARYPGVREVAVLVREDTPGDQRLVAYFARPTDAGVPEGPDSVNASLRDYLAEHLPEHMVPAAYVRLETLPLTPNGKLDRKALPAPDTDAYVTAEYEAPRGRAETIIAEIWADLLKVKRVGRRDQFFQMGGNSLLAVTLMERMRARGLRADVRAVFTNPTLALLAAGANQGQLRGELPGNLIPAGCAAITPAMLPLLDLEQAEIDRIVESVPGGAANIQDIYPLAPLQEGILFHHLMATDADPYLLSRMTSFDRRERLDGYLRALQSVMDRHDVLRTAIVWDGLSAPVQVVWRHAPLPVDEIVLDPDQEDGVQQLQRLVAPRHTRFDVHKAPLMRAAIAHDVKEGRWLMLMLFHHLMCDDATLDVMRSEIQAHLLGQDGQLPEPLPFRNFVGEARRAGNRSQSHKEFFERMLGDVDEPTAPFGLLQVQGDGTNIDEAHLTLAPEWAERLRTRARKLGVSPASVCHLACAQVLARVSGRDDVVFGTTLFGRMDGQAGIDRVMGLFMNTLPIRIKLGDEDVVSSVRRTQSLLAELLSHEHASLALAQSCSAVPAPAPLFTALFNYRHGLSREQVRTDDERRAWEGIQALHGEERTNYPLTLSVDDLGDAFKLKAQTQAPVEAMRVCHFMRTAMERLVEALEHAPATATKRIDVMPEAEQGQVLHEWNGTRTDYPADRCIHELIEAQARRTPDAVAAMQADHSLTYAQLNARANQLAHRLRALGVGPNDRVAICIERGLPMLTGLLAVLKTGAAYVPLDPAYPADRLTYMLRDCAPAAVLTQAGVEPVWTRASSAGATLPILDLTETPCRWSSESTDNLSSTVTGVTPRDLAYVIYTSGSTGTPKGVMVEHRGVVNLLTSMRSIVDIGSADRILSLTTFAFDIAALEFYLPLICGARVILLDRASAHDPAAVSDALIRFDATMLQATPATWRLLIESGWHARPGFKALCGGEALSGELGARLRERVDSVWNVYGPTETTIWSTATRLDNRAGFRPINESIGRPIANTRIYLLDDQGRPAPVGVAAELHIGGDGVARGYLNRPELSAERFLRDPFSDQDGARMYRTGDLARWLPGGDIEYLGRNDFQVKLRGFRIEPGEIEARLLEHPRIREAVVLAREDVKGDRRLVAYVVPHEPDVEHDMASAADQAAVGFSLFFFGADTYAANDKYRLYLQSARFADEHGFEAIWTPERHFHHVGSLYPNPSVLNAALATITRNVKLRAGSVVLPMHNPIRVAEEWAVVDNLSGGRVGMALATGWHSRDFVLAPENYASRKQVLQDGIATLKTLWAGNAATFRDGLGAASDVRIFPQPLQHELPLWITAAGNADTFVHAGKIGAHVLTHLLGQTVEQAAENIALYRKTRLEHGHDPATGKVTMMIHTFVSDDEDAAFVKSRQPFMNYLRAHLGLLAPMLKSLNISTDSLSEQDLDNIVAHAFDRYSRAASLIGTPRTCLPLVNQLRDSGVDEIACLIDWMHPDDALPALDSLRALRDSIALAPPDAQTLRRYCRAELPEYMVPSAYVQLDAMPLTPNGKLDRKALPPPDMQSFTVKGYEAPQGELENAIARIWAELVGVERVGRHDHFFELGGNSLLAVQCMSRLRQITKMELALSTLFAQPVLSELARKLSERDVQPALVDESQACPAMRTRTP